MITITLRLLECKVIVEDGSRLRTYIRHGVKPVAMLKLLTHLAYCQRYARISSNDTTQTYTFVPIMLCRHPERRQEVQWRPYNGSLA